MPDRDAPDPSQPEPAADATQRLPTGEPPSPYETQRLTLSEHLDPASTVKLSLPLVPEAAAATQRLSLPPHAGEPPIRVQRVDAPMEAEGSIQAGSGPRVGGGAEAAPTSRWKTPLLVAGLVGIALVVFVVALRGLSPSPKASPAAAPVVETPVEDATVPKEAQPYLARAKAGDTTAMQMLGLMYCNGLGVPRDREKGLAWYRKAAEGGSRGAEAELKRLEGQDGDLKK